MSAIRKQSGQRRQVLDYMVENKNANEISTLMGIHRSGVYKHRDAFIEYLQKVEGIDAKDVSMLFKL
jgi:FixJ family two-component response regulator